MKKVIMLSGVMILVTALVVFMKVPRTEAFRLAVQNGDLFSISEALGAKQITSLGDVKFIFDQKVDKILYGRGWHVAGTVTEMTGGTELWFRDGRNPDKRVTDEKVTYAFFDPRGEKVYYTNDSRDLFFVNVDGSSRTKITDKSLFPDLSRDGRYLAYLKLNADWQPGDYYDQALGIAVFDLQTSEEKQVTKKTEDFNPLWSPDGKKILYFSLSPEGLASHFIMNSDGTDAKQLTNVGEKFVTDKTIPVPSEKPIWSNDGQHLIYEADKVIWHIQLNSSLTSILKAEKVAYGISPQWNTDGKSVSVVISPQENEKSTQTVNLK